MEYSPAFGQEVARLREMLAAERIDSALLSEPSSICYTSGFALPLSIGAGGSFAAGPNLAAIGRSTSALLVSGSEAGAAEHTQGLETLIVYNAFDGFAPLDGRAEFLVALGRLLDGFLPSAAPAVLGIEPRSLPALVITYLAEHYPLVTLRDATAAVARARLIKTPREIRLLRRAAAAADAGQEALLANTRAGTSELSLWNALCAAIEAAASGPVPITGELVSGPRTSVVRYPGGPTGRAVEAGDTIICDISPCVNGYYADCCNTLVCGDPSAEQLRYYQAAHDAWEAAVDALRPGNRACDASNGAQAAFARHGLPLAHYTGHGIGASVNEAPRLVPYDQTPIEPGMVFAVEPGAYAGEGGTTGARTEKMVLVTAGGPEVLSRFTWGLAGR